MAENEALYESLMSLDDLNTLRVDQCLVHIGQLVDISTDLERIEGLKRAVTLLEDLQQRSLTGEERATSHYFLANAWSSIGTLSEVGTDQAWQWERDELEKELIQLRLAVWGEAPSLLRPERLCEILTNLGNAMDHAGRFVEAIEYWDRALATVPSFPMARGNRGLGLAHYASLLYDQGHVAVLLRHAHVDLGDALSSPLPEHARAPFDQCRLEIESTLPPKAEDLISDDTNGSMLGDSEHEIGYRRWCLKNRLFLNPLNDLGRRPIAARDVLCQPSIVVGIEEGPYHAGFFNQMKQEFVSARYLYYEGIQAASPHFSDREVLLFNTLDYPVYCLAAEKAKAAFRMAYSLFDKMAYFLNHYLTLSIPERRVKFRTLWYASQARKAGLRPEFECCRNWPLRGLFWLSKDLFEEAPGFKEALEPDAQQLWEIRNHLVHKYLKLHSGEWTGRRADENDLFPGLTDNLAYSLHRRDFEAKTLRLLKMARAALIYLSLAVHSEERRRAANRDPKTVIVGARLEAWDDGWKY